MNPNVVDYYQSRAPLVELTQIGNPEVNGGQPTPCYVDPSMIAIVYRSPSAFNSTVTEERFPYVEATNVVLTTGNHVSVLEAPAEIARRREEALGNKFAPVFNKPKAPEPPRLNPLLEELRNRRMKSVLDKIANEHESFIAAYLKEHPGIPMDELELLHRVDEQGVTYFWIEQKKEVADG